jgi:hypothetical protein
MQMAPKDSARVSVGLTRPELDEFNELARRCNTSLSALGQLAIKHMLVQARAGALPMLKPARLEDAEHIPSGEEVTESCNKWLTNSYLEQAKENLRNIDNLTK